MNNYNRFLLGVFLTGSLAIFIGALQKISGSELYHYALITGLVVKIMAIGLFIRYNFTDLRKAISSFF